MRENSRSATYSPQRAKSFRTAVKNFIKEEFPRFGGPKVIDLFLEELSRITDYFYPKAEYLRPGQLPWIGVARGEKPSYGKGMDQTRTNFGILPLVTEEDITKLEHNVPFKEVTQDRIARVLKHAYSFYNMVLSEAELSLIFSMPVGSISNHIRAYEAEHNTVLPRRGTIHDLGRSISHKVLICRKRYIDHKEPLQIAKETFHTPESVDRYLLGFERVKFCHRKGMDLNEISFSTQMSPSLVKEYLHLIEETECRFLDSTGQMT